MPTKRPARPRPASRAPKKKTIRKQKAGSSGLEASAALAGASDLEPALVARIEAEGGSVIGRYRDPYGGHPLVICVLPIDKVEPTPFQRDLSETHHKRLADVIHKTGRFLDPIIAVTAPDKDGTTAASPQRGPHKGAGFWTPNGRHRLEAMRRLGARSVTALVVADREVAWQILALNTEKAHNLKERALEVIRIYRGLLEDDGSRAESGFSFYLEDPALVTIGVCYERQPRFAGGAYHPILRRVEAFSDGPLEDAIVHHEQLAKLTLEVEAKVAEAVQRLRDKGLVSPYLRSFVVARINPLRWIQGEPPPAEEVLGTMRERASRFNVDKVRQEDLAKAGGVAEEPT